MTMYRTRPGVVLTEIAGEYMLVSARALQDICPPFTQINESSAFLWRQIETGATLEQLRTAVESEYEIEDREAAEAAIRAFVQQMQDMNYLVTE